VNVCLHGNSAFCLGDLEFRAFTFFGHFKLAALGDLDCLGRLVARGLGHVLDLVDDLEALEDLTEDDVLAVEPGGNGGGDEELGAVRVFSGVGHACEECASAACSFLYVYHVLTYSKGTSWCA
jgi:hypothetical protein